jgi:hypothetical protein
MARSDETTEGMGRGGYYDTHSEYQRAVAESAAQIIGRCVQATPLPGADGSYVIADYGCSTGANSIKMVTAAAEAVRARDPDASIAVLHNDVVTNDFNQLFTNVVGAEHSYLKLQPPALPLVSATTFFGPAAPRHSVHLGTSFSAAHWLSVQPEVAVSGFYFTGATGSAREALARQANDDWTTFLRCRADELVGGGRLLTQTVGSTDDGKVTATKLMTAMAEVADGMAADHLVDQSAVDRYILPVYARTAAEARSPLDDDPALATALKIEDVNVAPVANPYFVQWQNDHDDDAYARSYTAFVRGFTESSLRLHLFGDANDVVDEYFNRLRTRFAADPERDVFEDWTLTVVLSRR